MLHCTRRQIFRMDTPNQSATGNICKHQVVDVLFTALRSSPRCFYHLPLVSRATFINTQSRFYSAARALRTSLSLSSWKFVVPCYDRWVAFRDGAARFFVCVRYTWLQNDSWGKCMDLQSGKTNWTAHVKSILIFNKTK